MARARGRCDSDQVVARLGACTSRCAASSMVAGVDSGAGAGVLGVLLKRAAEVARLRASTGVRRRTAVRRRGAGIVAVEVVGVVVG